MIKKISLGIILFSILVLLLGCELRIKGEFKSEPSETPKHSELEDSP